MKGNSPDSNQPSFLLSSLKEQLDPNNPIYQLNERINWSVIEEDFKKLYSHTGRPAKPVRLMVSLLLLKQLEDLSDEQVIRWWVDILYWQYLSGETHFQWIPPAASSDLTHFRKRIGKKRCGTSIEVVDRSLQSKDPKGRSGHWYHGPGKKHHLSQQFQIGEKSHWHLQKPCESGRDSLKTELCESYPPTPSSGIEPEKSAAEKKGQEGNPETANHRSCPGSWTGPQDAPKTNQSLCSNPVGCLEQADIKFNL